MRNDIRVATTTGRTRRVRAATRLRFSWVEQQRSSQVVAAAARTPLMTPRTGRVSARAETQVFLLVPVRPTGSADGRATTMDRRERRAVRATVTTAPVAMAAPATRFRAPRARAELALETAATSAPPVAASPQMARMDRAATVAKAVAVRTKTARLEPAGRAAAAGQDGAVLAAVAAARTTSPTAGPTWAAAAAVARRSLRAMRSSAA